MEYSNSVLNKVTNVEMMLLELVFEKKRISGYEINKLVNKRGYRAWADIGPTSIYQGLEKLENKGLTESYLDMEKTGRGPLPRRFQLTRSGKETLRHSIIDALKNCRERDRRFDLALAGIPVLKKETVRDSLRKRKDMLVRSAQSIREKYNDQGGDQLPFHARIIFKHPLSMIEQELNFTQVVIDDLN